MNKNKLSWGSWLTVAGIAISGGLGLPKFGHPVAGERLFYFGLALAVVLAFGALATWALSPLKAGLGFLQKVVRGLVEAVAWLGALLFAPVIRRALRRVDYDDTTPTAWTASEKRGRQGCDFLEFTREGFRIAGGRFIVRPDRATDGWHAGFRLTSRNDRSVDTEPNATVLFQVSDFFAPNQDGYASSKDGADYGPWGLPAGGAKSPSFVFDFSLSAFRLPGMLWFSYRVDQQPAQAFECREEYGERLVLLAWAGGQDFRVRFEQISLEWVPERKRPELPKIPASKLGKV
jgi:hypothetical protein